MANVGTGPSGYTLIGTGITSSSTFAALGTNSGLTAHGVVIGQGNNPLTALTLTNGQLLIGNTGSDPSQSTLTAGSGVSITNGAGSITIAVATGTAVVQTLTGNSGGAISPTAGNINTVGSGSITVAGAGSTLTTQLTGLTNHAVQVGAGTATLTQVGPTATTGAVLQNNAGADPSYSTASYPSSTTINQLLYSSAANVIGGLATVNSAALVTSSTGVPGFSSTMTNGQLIIGSTGATPTAATLTAGAGVSITNAAASITVAVATGGFTWSNKAISYSAVAQNGYRSTAAITGSLPAAGTTDGTTIKFQATTTDVHTISPATTDVIQLGNLTSTNGTGGGSLASTAKGDYIELVYQNSSGTWFAQGVVGNWTVV